MDNTIKTTMALMTGLSQAVTVVKGLRDIDLKVNEAESKLKIAELHMNLSVLTANVAELKVEMIAKDERIRELEKQIATKAKMIVESNFYFKVEDDGSKEGPFCMNCFDVNSLEVRLPQGTMTWITCNNCKSAYDNPNAKPVSMGVIRSGSRDWVNQW